MGKTTIEFAKTLNSSERIGKLAIRDKVFDLVTNVISNSNSSNFRILTLPSIYWIFEYKLLRWFIKKFNDEKRIKIVSFERDYKLFCVSTR